LTNDVKPAACRFSAPDPHLPAKFAIAQQFRDSLSHGASIASRYEEPDITILDLFRDAADRRRYNGCPTRKSLDHRIRECVRAGRMNVDVGCLIVAGYSRRICLVRNKLDFGRPDSLRRRVFAQGE
jgi:hypothetical protein